MRQHSAGQTIMYRFVIGKVSGPRFHAGERSLKGVSPKIFICESNKIAGRKWRRTAFCMQISNNKILNTRNLEAGIFILMGGAKTVQDYRSVGEDYKQKILLNDMVVLGSSCAAMIGYRALSHSNIMRDKFFRPTVEFMHKKFIDFCNTDFAKKHLVGKFDSLYHPLHKPLEMSKEIIGTCISNTLMVASGLFGAIAGDYALTKIGFGIHRTKNLKTEENTKPSQLVMVENFKKNKVDTVIDKRIQEEAFWRVLDFPAFNVLTSPFVGLQGLEITDDEKYSKQVKNASKSLLVNSLVPLFFFSLSSALTKKLKNIYRIPIMFASLLTGTLAVKSFLDHKLNKPHKN